MELSAEPDLNFYKASPNGYYAIYFASKDQVPPYDQLTDVNLRRAVNYAIDRETIAAQIYGGFVSVAKTITPPTIMSEIDAAVEGYTLDTKYDAPLVKALRSGSLDIIVL